MAELKVKIETDLGPIEDLLEAINAMQTYKLFENDDMLLVDKADLCEILVRHVRTRRSDEQLVKCGRWVEHNYDPEYLICDFSCSECGYFLDEYYCGEGCWPGKTDHYFCTNCGARMSQEGE